MTSNKIKCRCNLTHGGMGSSGNRVVRQAHGQQGQFVMSTEPVMKQRGGGASSC